MVPHSNTDSADDHHPDLVIGPASVIRPRDLSRVAAGLLGRRELAKDVVDWNGGLDGAQHFTQTFHQGFRGTGVEGIGAPQPSNSESCLKPTEHIVRTKPTNSFSVYVRSAASAFAR